jgi:hypothetical protein
MLQPLIKPTQLLMMLVPCVCHFWLQELLKVQLALLLLAMLGALSAAGWTGAAIALLLVNTLLFCLLFPCRLSAVLLMLLLLCICACASRTSPTSQKLGHSSTAACTTTLLNKLCRNKRQPYHRPGSRLDAPEQLQRCSSDDISAHAVLGGRRRHGTTYAAIRGAAAAT